MRTVQWRHAPRGGGSDPLREVWAVAMLPGVPRCDLTALRSGSRLLLADARTSAPFVEVHEGGVTVHDLYGMALCRGGEAATGRSVPPADGGLQFVDNKGVAHAQYSAATVMLVSTWYVGMRVRLVDRRDT